MSGLGESKKRDFVSQMIVILKQNSQLLTDNGFDPTLKITLLEENLVAADDAEGRQTEAKAAAKAATIEAKETLVVAYSNGSAVVESVVGALGKKHPLVQEIKKLRRYGKSKPKNDGQA